MKVIYLRHGVVGYRGFAGIDATMSFIVKNEQNGPILVLCIYEKSTGVSYLPKRKTDAPVDAASLVSESIKALNHLGITPIKTDFY